MSARLHGPWLVPEPGTHACCDPHLVARAAEAAIYRRLGRFFDEERGRRDPDTVIKQQSTNALCDVLASRSVARQQAAEAAGMRLEGPCEARTAYATLLTQHDFSLSRNRESTALSRPELASIRLQFVQLLLYSIRRVETCRRDFVLLLGSNVTLPSDSEASFLRNGVRVHRVTPIVPGVPAADKLHAWRLLQHYTRVVLVDSDVLVLRPLDDLFATSEDLTIAHHPYDLVQGASCGVMRSRRAVSALFALNPSATTFDALVRHLRGGAYNAYHLRHFSEQTAIACFFANRSRILPCAYLFDLGTLQWQPGQGGVKSCGAHSARMVTRATPRCARAQSGCAGHFGPAVCSATALHLQRDECRWSASRSQVRAIHFKGVQKPWRILSKWCTGLRSGRLVAVNATVGSWALRMASEPAAPLGTVDARDEIHWIKHSSTLADGPNARCVSLEHANATVRWSHRPPSDAEWASWTRRQRYLWQRALIVPRYCCNLETLLTTEWFAMNASMARRREAVAAEREMRRRRREVGRRRLKRGGVSERA